MFNRAKKVFNSKIQEQQEEKKKIEESNKAYKSSMKRNRKMVESRLEEANKNLKCPLCQGDKFFKNIRIAYSNYHGEDCSTYIAIDKEDGMSAFNWNKHGIVPINVYVCKKCGYIIQKMDFSKLDDHCFRDGDTDFENPLKWDESGENK